MDILYTEKELKIRSLLAEKGIREAFPYIENGEVRQAESFEEIILRAVISYENFSLILQNNKDYSKREINFISQILNYQKEMGAFHHTVKLGMSYTDEDIQNYSWEKVKGILHKRYKQNRGIYFIPALKAYTSTQLHESYIPMPGAGRTGHEGCGSKKRYRVYGKMTLVLPSTLNLFDGSGASAELCYPYSYVDDTGTVVDDFTQSIYELYEIALEHKNLVLRFERSCFSNQEKRVVKKLQKELGEDKPN